MTAQMFWLIMTIAVLAWYSTITIYVAIRGSFDVKDMLRRLKEGDEREGK
jgi:hypothetical protein